MGSCWRIASVLAPISRKTLRACGKSKVGQYNRYFLARQRALVRPKALLKTMSNDNKQSIAAMPDITNDTESGSGTALNWVGMSRIELPVMLRNSSGQTFQSLASVQAYVNIAKPEVKGIHMSRLYLLLDQKLGMAELTPALLQEVVAEFIVSQEGISDSAFIECKLDYFERRASLKSDNTGWKNYPLRLQASSRKGVVSTELELEIPYSSTCPCSAALARQLIQQSFEDKFGAEGQVEAKDVSTWLRTPKGTSATPHSQRSIAQVRLRLQDDAAFAITPLIDAVEEYANWFIKM